MNKQIIEINGVKLEVDLSTARRIDEFKIGDPVKVLVKEYSGDKVYPGIIIEFANFKNNPTIIIAYLEMNYSSAQIKYIYYNANSTESIASTDFTELPYEKGTVIDYMDREIYKKEQELMDLKNKKSFFINHFDKYFGRFFETNQ